LQCPLFSLDTYKAKNVNYKITIKIMDKPMLLNIIFLRITLFLYFIGAALYLWNLVSNKKGIANAALWTAGAGFVVHTAAIIIRMSEAGYIPITSLREAISFFSWAIILIFLITAFRYRVSALGSFLVPLAFILMASVAIRPMAIRELPPMLQSAWLGIHTILILLGGAAFALSFVVGLMYLIQDRNLKAKKIDTLYRKLPSLDILDELNHKAIVFGYILFTLGIISGSIWAEYAWGTYWSWDPKQTMSAVIWFIYTAFLHARFTYGWRGRKAAYLSIGGFVTVIFTFVGINLIIKTIHNFTS
jgi:cytochrome c-type biogenesis protein CcsB